MVSWLTEIGLPSNGDFAFVTDIAAACIAIMIVVLITSCLFGVANAIFRK